MARDRFADVLKGYACLLVIFGHVLIGIRTSGTAVPAFCLPAEKFIWSFHIDLFMFLSGFVYSLTGGSKRSGSAKDFLLSKLAALGIPYIIFSSLYTAVNCLTPGVNNQSSFSDLLTLWYKPVAQYWFIFALFWLFVLWTLLSKFLPNFAVTLILYAVFLFGKCLCKPDSVFRKTGRNHANESKRLPMKKTGAFAANRIQDSLIAFTHLTRAGTGLSASPSYSSVRYP